MSDNKILYLKPKWHVETETGEGRMKPFETLKNYLQSETDGENPAVAETILCLADAMIQISKLVARGPLAGAMGAARGDNAGGDVQKELDIVANDAVIDALQEAPVAYLVSEELEDPLVMQRTAPLYVAIDPLDGSSNIETNAAVGTIFAIFPAMIDENTTVDAGVLQPGVNQLAAGYCIYGPQTSLVLTLGNGTHIFTLDPVDDEFRLTAADVRISETTREFAINVSNFRHWDRHVRSYIDDCLAGEEGHRQSNYNMRWIASLVAECQRILARGGIFLYPGDARKGYAHGRLRLLYECSPIAFLVEQAGGGATTGKQRILEVTPENIHQRVPMIFGSSRETRRVERYYAERDMHGERSQLFNKRGLFRA
jgi:fructose-1,6-bisphosphatase I